MTAGIIEVDRSEPNPFKPRRAIHTQLLAIMAEVGPVAKSHRKQGKEYRSINDVLDVLSPALIKHLVHLRVRSLSQKIYRDWEEKAVASAGKRLILHAVVKLELTFVSAIDGSESVNVLGGEGFDYTGPAATSVAYARAFRDCVFFALCIPVTQNDGEETDFNKGRGPQQNSQQPQPTQHVQPHTQPPPRPSGPAATQTQLQEIWRLKTAMQIPDQPFFSMLQQHAGSPHARMESLNGKQADGLLAQLRYLETQHQAASRF